MNVPPKNAVTENRNGTLSTANPFCSTSTFNLPLKLELCQQIHAAALRRAARCNDMHTIPATVALDQLRENIHRYGQETCLIHPTEIKRLFQGVTLSVYQMIELLYCSRLGRNSKMIYRILDAMARSVGVPSLEEEAIWAICMHLEERHAQRTAVTIERSSSAWWLIQIAPIIDPEYHSGSDGPSSAAILCIIDAPSSRVLAFRMTERRVEELSCSLVLYDAIVSQRRPHQLGAAGLIWYLPQRLITEVMLPEVCQKACESLGVRVERASHRFPLSEKLEKQWSRELRERRLRRDRLALVFDSYLHMHYGTSPLRDREAHNDSFSHLVGYQKDPSWQFPALRMFLPLHSATIGQEGTVAFDGLHYIDELLSYWPESAVTVRRSEHTEAALWVYLDGDILCQAMAYELARRDGSYRIARVRR